MNRVVVAGEINVDLVLRGSRPPRPGAEVLVDDARVALGSASAICAAGLARLGTPVRFAGVVGDDPFGEYCLVAMRDAGVDVSCVRVDPLVRTGVTVSLTGRDDRALVTYLGSIEALAADQVDDDLLATAAHLHVSSFYMQRRLRPGLSGLFRRARRLGLTTSLDPGFDPSEAWAEDLHAVLAEVDLFFPNEVELERITGCREVAEALARLDNGVTRTVAKLGLRGAVTRDGDALIHQPSFPVETIDTTGAGDSFVAGYLHAFVGGAAVGECLALAAACGALSTRALGGVGGQPDAREAARLAGGGGGA